jgi:hypothetical protein
MRLPGVGVIREKAETKMTTFDCLNGPSFMSEHFKISRVSVWGY